MSGDSEKTGTGILFDTEFVPAGYLGDKKLNFFTRPMGQTMVWGAVPRSKTWLDTNMVMAACLPQPRTFRIRALRLGMSEEVPYVDRLRVYAHGVLHLFHGSYNPVTLPLSAIPAGRLLQFQSYAENDRVFGDPEMPFALPVTPVQIGLSEMVYAEVTWPGSASESLLRGEPRLVLDGPVPFAVYLLGDDRKEP